MNRVYIATVSYLSYVKLLLTIYLFTHTAHYPHQPIIAYSQKKVSRLNALGYNPHLKSKENLYKRLLNSQI